MGTPHKHAELIKAWADGATIEVREDAFHDWEAVGNPSWSDWWEYRIKPEEKKPVVRWKWAKKNEGTSFWVESDAFYTEEEADVSLRETKFKLEFTRTEFPS